MGWVRGGGAGGWGCIENVVPGKQADVLGVKVGWKIIAVDSTRVSSAEEFTQATKLVKDRANEGGSGKFTISFAVTAEPKRGRGSVVPLAGRGGGRGGGRGKGEVRGGATAVVAASKLKRGGARGGKRR